MMQIGRGNRDQWEFDYTARNLADGAKSQREFRLGRVAFWQDAKTRTMVEVKESGIEVSESAGASVSNYTTGRGPQVMVRADLQGKLSECHTKIAEHQQAADDYAGWIQVLEANPEVRLKLTHADWLYFFGKS